MAQEKLITILIRYPETDCRPDIVLLPRPEKITIECAMKCIHESILAMDQKNYDDRMEKLDFFFSQLEDVFGYLPEGISVNQVVEI